MRPWPKGCAVQEHGRHAHHLAPLHLVLKHRAVDHGVANLRIERRHGVQRLDHVGTALAGQRNEGLEIEFAVQILDLIDDGLVDLGRIAAGLQQRQHQRGELMPHGHAGESHLRLGTGPPQRERRQICSGSRPATFTKSDSDSMSRSRSSISFATSRRRRARRRFPPVAKSAPGSP
jgi:hypothetical protein